METKLTIVETNEVYRSITINYPDEMNENGTIDTLLNVDTNDIHEYVNRLRDKGVRVRIDKKVLDSVHSFEIIDGETKKRGED